MTETTKKEKFNFKHLPSLLKDTGKAWNNDDPWRLSAVVAYYALLSLPGLLVIILNTVGAIWGQEIVEGRVTGMISGIVGIDAAETVQNMLKDTQDEEQSLISTIIGIATLIFGATGVFYHLQLSINAVWEIKTDPKAGFKKLLLDRVISFGFVLVIGFLLLVSFVITAGISILQKYIEQALPEVMVYLVYILNTVVSVGILTVLFALIFRFLPDAQVRWKTVWIGSIITALLFILGEYLLGLYFANASPGSAYGAAGSIIIILLWVSYACLILFFGAEFTWIYSKRYGIGIKPKGHAIHFKHREIIQEKGSDIEEQEEREDKVKEAREKKTGES